MRSAYRATLPENQGNASIGLRLVRKLPNDVSAWLELNNITRNEVTA